MINSFQHFYRRIPLNRTLRVCRHFLSVDIRLASLALFFLGFGILSRAYLVPGGSGASYILFWIGMGACYIGAVIMGTHPNAKTSDQVVALILLSCAIYLPNYLRNPIRPGFQDELFHVQILEMMHDYLTTSLPITLFPIPGDHPGLEFMGLAGHYLSDIPIIKVVRLVPFVIHTTLPVIAYYILRSFNLSQKMTFWASLVYISNNAFFFFHSLFSYETLGTLFFLTIVILSLEKNSLATNFLLLATVTSIITTHHVSALISIFFLIISIVSKKISTQTSEKISYGIAAYGVVVWLSWHMYNAIRTEKYLYYNLRSRFYNILYTFQSMAATTLPAQTQATTTTTTSGARTRALFAHSTIPFAERVLVMLFPVAILCLASLGVYYFIFGSDTWLARFIKKIFAALLIRVKAIGKRILAIDRSIFDQEIQDLLLESITSIRRLWAKLIQHTRAILSARFTQIQTLQKQLAGTNIRKVVRQLPETRQVLKERAQQKIGALKAYAEVLRARITANNIALGIFGPILWLASCPIVITQSQDIAFRAWPFLFVGVALYAAIGIGGVFANWRWGWVSHNLIIFSITALTLAGGMVLGDNQAGRFRPSEVHFAAGPEALTDDLIAAAQWVRTASGEYNVVVGDKATSIAFAVFGIQKTNLWNQGLVYYFDDLKTVEGFVNHNKIDYVVVDFRTVRFPPRYGTYFTSGNTFFDLIPIASLSKFDYVANLQRVYDNGDIVLYRKY